MIFPVAAIRKKKVVRKFLECGAISPETAVTPSDAGVVKGLVPVLSGLEKDGTVKACKNGRFYVDLAQR